MADKTAEQARSADELLDVVDEHDRVVGRARRGEAVERRLRHRAVAVRVRDAEDRIFVHRRTADKLIFPSLYDPTVGGVVGAGEGYDEAALREAEEELGVRGLPRPEFRLKFSYEAAGHAWFMAVYEVRCVLPVRPQAEEIAWWAFLPEEEAERRLGGWEVVPDGMECHRRLREWHRGRGREATPGDG